MNAMARMSNKLDPAYSLIRKFDTSEKRGTFVLATRLGVDRSTVQKWTMPREKGGTGGFVPFDYCKEILAFARELDVPLDPSEFILSPDEKSEHAAA